ncbi:putative oxygenase [Xylaria nigripes]|nr:putative oxygenase [Xylaria nigripes]
MNAHTEQEPEIRRFRVNDNAAAVCNALVDDGVAVIEGFLSSQQVAKLNEEFDPRLARIQPLAKTTVSATPNNPYPWKTQDVSLTDAKPVYWMADLVAPCVKRLQNLAGISKTFRQDVLNHQLMHEICRKAFEDSGDYWLGFSAAIESGPGTEGQIWHRDQPYSALVKSGPGTPEGMLNFFVALTDFTPETGVTEYIWRSNQRQELGEPDEEHPVVMTELKAGDVAVLSGKIVHRGGANLSPEFHRRAMALVILPVVLAPFDAACALPRRVVETMTPLAQKMVGWRSLTIAPPLSLGVWCMNMRELGGQLGLKSSMPEEDTEKE